MHRATTFTKDVAATLPLHPAAEGGLKLTRRSFPKAAPRGRFECPKCPACQVFKN